MVEFRKNEHDVTEQTLICHGCGALVDWLFQKEHEAWHERIESSGDP